MGTSDGKANTPRPIEDIWDERRKAFLDTINERIRTVALGSLVLIWGLFIGGAHKDVSMKNGSRISLLAVACGAVFVLLIEYVEQWTGYLGAKQAIPGSVVKPYGFPYTVVSRRMFYLKHLLGVSTIIALIVVLALLLVRSVANAQVDDPLEPYIGKWCGSDSKGHNWMHLSVEIEANKPKVQFRWKDQPYLSECTSEMLVQMTFTCVDDQDPRDTKNPDGTTDPDEAVDMSVPDSYVVIKAQLNSHNLDVTWTRHGKDHSQKLVTCQQNQVSIQ